ncbi:MtnX-like HAD-IB family phosphatase [Phenylobacterium sp.]|uniref:MtnX-like HAD-IB family phosphatase n=1 Tax=Phenylobacterium sp. TaxID=1871053 RepID=UPI0025CC76DB|nr:MtnX-like HAD-IB family phosphatase [Phenylobacterium sp.]
MRIICDFDGTITRRDTTDLVLERLADPAWRAVEDDWVAGRITAAACMRAQIALIGGSRSDLDALLDTVELDPGFVAFVAWCGEQGFPVSIVSDGVDHFIDRILARHDLAYLPVIANRLAGDAGAWALEQPWSRDGCAAGSGVCKCAALGAWSDGPAAPLTVYVGDGRSDFCVSSRADLLFAKDALADYATARAQDFIPFDSFDDVTRALVLRLSAAPAGARVATL